MPFPIPGRQEAPQGRTDPRAYRQAIQQSNPPDEIDRLRATFGFVPASAAGQMDPFWRALSMTLTGQHDASDALQEMNASGEQPSGAAPTQNGPPGGPAQNMPPGMPSQNPSQNMPTGTPDPNNPAVGA